MDCEINIKKEITLLVVVVVVVVVAENIVVRVLFPSCRSQLT